MSDDDAALTPAQEELLGLWLAEEVPGVRPGPERHVPPRNRAEAALADIWAEALEVPRVGVADDYFALGGDSVLAIVVVARAAEAGLDVSVRDLFEARTIAGLSLTDDRLRTTPSPVTAADGPSATAPSAAAADVDLPLTPLQEGILFHSLTSGRQRDGYLVQAHCLVTGPVDLPLLRRAWEAVLAAEPALRTAFRLSGPEGPRRWIAPVATLPWTEKDWRDHDVRAALAEHLRRDRAAGFDLEHPPLSRVAVFREARDRHRIVWTHHHLVLDGWSQQIVLRAVLDHYAGLAGAVSGSPEQPLATNDPGLEAPTVPPAVPSADEEAHWRGLLAGARPTLLVPDRNDAGEPQSPGRAVATDVWPTGLVTAVEAFAADTGVTVATVLTGCWGLVAAARTGAEEAVFGLTVSGRTPAEAGVAERVGMFVNTLATRVTAKGPSTEAWLRTLQRRLSESRRHSGTPLSRAVRWSGHDRLFDSLLVVENFPTWLAPGTRVAGLVVDDIDVVLDEGYPVVVEVAMYGGLAVRLRHDTSAVPPTVAHEILGEMCACVEQMVTGAVRTPGELRTAVVGRRADARDRAAHVRRAKARDLLAAVRRHPVRGDEPGGTG
ncbi:condensation domain-containing protein [Kitasatospora sp. NPDC101235]|uniref:condensation domain-containing protein n=1 Tax=Kitasatospora sp. NPDC101235 TaxID=3364101 RepID=UPI0037F22D34